MDYKTFKGKYVVVRCRDAGVHAGVLEDMEQRVCRLSEARRLWRWRVAKDEAGNQPCFLGEVAAHGLSDDYTRVGQPVDLFLTENCEVILCSEKAEKSIREKETFTYEGD